MVERTGQYPKKQTGLEKEKLQTTFKVLKFPVSRVSHRFHNSLTHDDEINSQVSLILSDFVHSSSLTGSRDSEAHHFTVRTPLRSSEKLSSPLSRSLPRFHSQKLTISLSESELFSGAHDFSFSATVDVARKISSTMLQWMGGSRRKVDTSRRSTQKRQKQYFEQRKWQEQQKKNARESFFDEKSPCNQQEKNSRSLDILSLLNVSTGSGEHKSNVHSARHIYEDNQMLQPSPVIQTKEVIYLGPLQHKEGTSPSSQDYAACPNHTSVGAPGGHERGLYNTNDKVNPLANSTSKQLSIIDILGDDGPNYELESSTHEGHVAFSIEGLGKVEMSTPVHSPQLPGRPLAYGRPSPPRARRKALSSDYLNKGIDGIDLELDSMMVDVELPFHTSPFDRSSCSRGVQDSPGSAEHKLLDTKWFSSNNNFTCLYTFENDEIFGKNKGSSHTILNANSSFPLPESFHEDYCSSHLDAVSTDFWNNQSCGMREFNFEDCYSRDFANSCSARNYGKQDTYFDDSYHQKQSVRMKAKSEFNIIDAPTPYSKHFKPENFSVSDGEWCSMGCTSPHLMDYIDHVDRTWFANEDARDNLSLLSEESSTAVVGDLDTQQKVNSNNKRRSQEVSDGRKETKFCEKLFANERNCKRNDIQQGKPTKLPWLPNQSRAKPENYNSAFYEKRSDMNNDGLREARCGPGESNSRFRSFYQTSASKRYVSTCSDFLVGDVLTDQEPKLQVDSLHNLEGSIEYPGEYAPSCFMMEPITFELDSPACTFRNLFQDAKKGCGAENSLHTLGSHGTVTGNIVRDVGSDGDKGVDILPFDSSQFDPNTEVSGRCKSFSSGKEKSMDGSSSVNECSNCDEPKEKIPEVKDRTGSFNYSECAEEASSSVEMSTVSKGDQDSLDKNQDTQSSLRYQAGDEVTKDDSRSSSKEGMITTRQSHNIHQNGQVMMLEAVSFNFYMCSF
ncbi:uncharacterized protein [Solanum tuberosum]|nr:PREDICTED: uncharacterized protein LOC102581598 [Solanum tuberosum]